MPFTKGHTLWKHPNCKKTQFKKGGAGHSIPHSEDSKRKVSFSKGGKWIKDKDDNWVEDASLLVQNEKKHLCIQYREWMRAVKERDGWTCRIADVKCNGSLEAHHILRWSKFPELRYEVNNGITLCHFHHPRKINDEMRLIPIFKGLVKQAN